MLLTVAALAAVGCNAILGIESDYTDYPDDGGADGAVGDGGSTSRDATTGGGQDAGPVMDASGSNDAAGLDDVIDASSATCSDGATSPRQAVVGSPCCAPSALGCDVGQQLEQIICVSGVWSPNGPCTGATLCRFDTGEYPDGGPENNGSIVGNGSNSGDPGTCATEITGCTDAGAIFCSGSKLVLCGLDLTTAYEESCVPPAQGQSTGTELCAAHVGPHCPACLDGVDFQCNGNAPAYCSDAGFIQGSPCEAGTTCQTTDGTCSPDFCNPGLYKCVGDNLQQCDPAAGTAYNDAGLCEAGTCDVSDAGKVGTCDFCPKGMPYGCASTTSYTSCNATGSGTVTTTCSGALPFCSQVQGGSASCVQCLSATDCTMPTDACHPASCNSISGSCGYPPLKAGTVVVQPQPGACTETTCEGANDLPTVTNLPDNTVVVPPNGMTCTEMVCTNGVAGPANAPAGTTCVEADGVTMSTCDANGNCM